MRYNICYLVISSMTYALALRRKIFKIKSDRHLTFLEISQLFTISMATLFRWSKKIEPNTTRNKPTTKINMDALKKDISTFSDAYQFERTERLGVSTGCIFHAFECLNVSYKKNFESSQGVRRQTTSLPKAH